LVLAAGLAILGLSCSQVGLMIMGGGGQVFFVASYAFFILAAVRFVWVVASRGRAPAELPIPDRRAQWLLGGFLAFVIWSTLFAMMTTSGPWYPWEWAIGAIRWTIRAAWAALTGQSPSADLFPF
jgi:hypothetical protein